MDSNTVIIVWMDFTYKLFFYGLMPIGWFAIGYFCGKSINKKKV